MDKPTNDEIDHGIKLLRDEANRQWEGAICILPIDPTCGWNHGDGRCGQRLHEVVLLRHKDNVGISAIALCEHHTRCMEAAVDRWRTMT